MCALAHVLEAAGLSTVVLSPIRAVAEKVQPPRALQCEFPLGLPLGKPRDPEFQHQVLEAAFALFERPSGPVLEDFPIVIDGSEGEPLSCPLPARYDPELPAAVDEAQALRPAYDRALKATGRTSVGRHIQVDEIPGAIAKFAKIAEGAAWDKVFTLEEVKTMPPLTMLLAHDIRAYYEELSAELVDGPPRPWATERWFYEETEAGKAIIGTRRAMMKAEAPQMAWFYMAVGPRQ